MLGKWKATIQFAALTIAMLRPDVIIAGAYLDEWGMVFAALVTAWSGVDYLLKFSASLRSDLVSRVFVTGGSGVIGGALVERLVARGDDVVALARSDEAAAALQRARRRGRARRHARRGRAGARHGRRRAGLPRRRHQHALRRGPRADAARQRRRRRGGGPRRRAGRACRALVHTSSAATLGEAPGTVGREDTPHRGWYLSTYERTKTEGERAVARRGAGDRPGRRLVNPSSVQGPGRAGGTGRFLLAFLDGRLKVFVQTNVSLVDIADCVEGHLLAAERGQPGERYLLNGDDADHHRGARARRRGRRRAAQAAAAAAPGGDGRRGRRRGRLSPRAPHAAGVPRDGPHAAARPPLRRLARRARARPALHRPARDVRAARSTGRARPGS